MQVLNTDKKVNVLLVTCITIKYQSVKKLDNDKSGQKMWVFLKLESRGKHTLTEPHAPTMHVHMPSTANAFSGLNY